MKIAVVDVAAEYGGAMTVLADFLDFIQSRDDFCRAQQWTVYTSVKIDVTTENVKNIVIPEIKKSWFHRLYWEKSRLIKSFKDNKYDVVISLQNAAFRKGKYRQVAYFHNILLLEDAKKYSVFKRAEREYAIYTKLISKYTLHSLENTDAVIVQTDIVKDRLEECTKDLNIRVIHPNVHIDKRYRNTAMYPIKGLICPTSAAPFKKIEEIINCVVLNRNWFEENNFRVLITLTGEENEYARRLKQSSARAGKAIEFIGRLKREKLLEMYTSYGLFISSELESFSIPFVEAEFVGSPIVAARYPYAEERTRGVGNAFLYTPGDMNELMECIKKAAVLKSGETNNIDIAENTWEQMIPIIAGEQRSEYI